MRLRPNPTLVCWIAALSTAMLLLSACAQQAPDTSALDAMTAQLDQNKATVTRFFTEVVNNDNLDVINEICIPEMVDHEEMPVEWPAGREGVRAYFTELQNAFPDMQVTLDHMVAEGDLVTFSATWTGTQEGEFMGFPASGNPVTFASWEMVRIVDGQCVEHWGLTDGMALMDAMEVIDLDMLMPED